MLDPGWLSKLTTTSEINNLVHKPLRQHLQMVQYHRSFHICLPIANTIKIKENSVEHKGSRLYIFMFIDEFTDNG